MRHILVVIFGNIVRLWWRFKSKYSLTEFYMDVRSYAANRDCHLLFNRVQKQSKDLLEEVKKRDLIKPPFIDDMDINLKRRVKTNDSPLNIERGIDLNLKRRLKEEAELREQEIKDYEDRING